MRNEENRWRGKEEEDIIVGLVTMLVIKRLQTKEASVLCSKCLVLWRTTHNFLSKCKQLNNEKWPVLFMYQENMSHQWFLVHIHMNKFYLITQAVFSKIVLITYPKDSQSVHLITKYFFKDQLSCFWLLMKTIIFKNPLKSWVAIKHA